MSSDSTGDSARVRGALKARMAKFLLHGGETQSLRTGTLLQKNHLLRRATPIVLGDLMPAVVLDPKHPNRDQVGPGPLLFVREPSKPHERLAIEATQLLFDSRREMRHAVLEHLDQQVIKRRTCGVRTDALVRDQRALLLSDEQATWQAAAVCMADAVADDLLCNLAGAKQCACVGYDAGWKRYISSVLRPALASLEGLPLPLWSATEQRSQVQALVTECAESALPLADALSRYYHVAGHLPLGGELSMAEVMRRRSRDCHQGHESVWEIMWAWANAETSPLARYHVCQALAGNPELIPEGKHASFWQEVVGVVDIPLKGDTQHRWASAWRIRCDLARHYSYHIQCQAPGQSGERIASVSWWIAEQVGQLFPTDPDAADRVRDEITFPQSQRSGVVWQLVTPPVRPSPLGYGTLLLSSVWSTALVAELSANLQRLRADLLDVADHDCMEDKLISALSLLFPLHAVEPHTFGFDRTVVPTAEAWLVSPHARRTEEITAFVALARSAGNQAELGEALDQLGTATEGIEVAICNALRVAAYLGEAPVDAMWAKLTNQDWRDRFLVHGHLSAVTLFCDALLQIILLAGERWAWNVPHFMALACEQTAADERRQTLLMYAIVGATCGDTASALERLLGGSIRGQLRADAATWRSRLDGLWPLFPPWAAAKLRAVRATLGAI